MTHEELKAHRRAICEALIEGKQCQVMGQYKVRPEGSWFYDKPDEWFSCDATTVAHWLFDSDDIAARVRIKPEPRKCWIGWFAQNSKPEMVWCEWDKINVEAKYNGPIKWQTVVEEQS